MTIPKIEDYKAPWEKDLKDGEEPKVDLDKLKVYVHGLLGDKEKIQGRLTAAEADRDTFKKEAETKTREGETAEAKANRERDEAIERAETAEKEAKTAVRLRVALAKGLTEKQVGRLAGETEEELLADADDYLADLKPAAGNEADEEREENLGFTTPRSRLRNGGDPKGGGGDADDFDVKKLADLQSRVIL